MKRNIYVPNNRPPKYIKQKLTELKVEIDNSTITVGHDYPTLNNGWIEQPDRI